MGYRIQLLAFASIVSLPLQISPLIAGDGEDQLIIDEAGNFHYEDKSENDETAQKFSAGEEDSAHPSHSTDISNHSLDFPWAGYKPSPLGGIALAVRSD